MSLASRKTPWLTSTNPIKREHFFFLQREALAKPREEELDPISKYYYATKKNIYGYRPLSWKGHWIKTPHPREIITPTIYHYKPNIKQDQKHLEHIEGNRRVDRRFRDKGSKKIKFD